MLAARARNEIDAAAPVSAAERSMTDMTGLVVALDVLAVVVLVAFATGDRFVPVTAVVIAPLAASAFSRPVTTLFTTAIAVMTAMALGARGGLWGTADLHGSAGVVVVGGCVGAVLASLRERREASLALTGRRLRAEHEVVSILQESFLPEHDARIPSGIELATTYRPVNGRVAIGGDWLDSFALDDRRVALSIGDVAGHGLESAVLMVQLRLGIRMAALRGLDPGEVLDETGRLLQSIAPDGFATAVFAIYDTTTHRLCWSRAGHCLPVLASSTGARLLDDAGGPPLGVCSGQPYAATVTDLPPDHVVVVHTDGLYERHDRSISLGETLLIDLLPALLEEEPDLRRCIEWLPALVHETEPEDDICVLALRRC